MQDLKSNKQKASCYVNITGFYITGGLFLYFMMDGTNLIPQPLLHWVEKGLIEAKIHRVIPSPLSELVEREQMGEVSTVEI